MNTTVTRTDIFDLLSIGRLGAFGTKLDGTIVFWNRRAEQILGHAAADILDRRSDDVLESSAPVATIYGANSAAGKGTHRTDDISSPITVSLRCASGAYKSITLTVIVFVDNSSAETVFLNVFDDSVNQAVRCERTAAGSDSLSTAPSPSSGPRVDSNIGQLSARETEILKLVASGHSSDEIATNLRISIHTVRNHVRSLRNKLNSRTKLDAVMTAVRNGLL